MKVRYLWVIAIACSVLMFCQVGMAQEERKLGLEVGRKAPDFTALTYQGKKVTLSEYYQQGPVVLIFYRGEWCPYCNLQLKSYQAKIEDFKKLGASIIALSVDKQEYGAKIAQKDGLTFDIVSDPQIQLLTVYHVTYSIPDELAETYRNEYKIDLETFSGRKDHVIAYPATYVIDQTGKIIFANVSEDYKVRTKPEEILEILNKMQ